MPLHPEIDPETDTQQLIDIEGFMTLGDSLSDRGTMDKRRLFGIIPMDFLAGLKGRSPRGRFTNGFTWDDHLAAMIASELDIEALRRQRARTELPGGSDSEDEVDADLSDNILVHQRKTEKTLRKHAYTLDDDLHVHYHGENLLDSYNEGGLTAHSYRWQPSFSASRFGSRMILSTLTQKREKALDYARKHNISAERRKKTLVTEWSGANDLITVNDHGSPKEVKDAVHERIKNILEMAKHGYRRFMLFDMPDLSKTPRFQNKLPKEKRGKQIDYLTLPQEAFDRLKGGELEVANAQLASHEFNRLLREQLNSQDIQQQLKEICGQDAYTTDVFSVSETFDEVYQDPAKYEFDPAKKHQPYTKSKDFKTSHNHIRDCHGHMFWDDVHPSAHMHKLLADKAYAFMKKKYNFIQPISDKKERHKDNMRQLVADFQEQYSERLDKDKRGIFGGWYKGNLLKGADLKGILTHALFEKGDRTMDIIKKLGWFSSDDHAVSRNAILSGQVHAENFAIEKALHDIVNERHCRIQHHHGAKP